MKNEIHTYIEPELQARITAYVLGEASEFERDELEKLFTEKKELAAFRKHVENMHAILAEVTNPSTDEEWQLSGERRDFLAKEFASEKKDEKTFVPRDYVQWRAGVGIAACLVLTVVIIALAKPVLWLSSNIKSASPEIVTYSAAPDDQVAHLEKEKGYLSEEATFKNGRKSESRFERTVDAKPSPPSSNMAKVIAANGKTKTVIPVPNVEVPDPSADFGDGDDVGEGFGSGADPFGGGQGKGKQLASKGRVDNDEAFLANSLGQLADVRSGGIKKDLSGLSHDRESTHYYSKQKVEAAPQVTGVWDSFDSGEEKRTDTRRESDEFRSFLAAGSEQAPGNIPQQSSEGLRSGDYAITRNSIDSILSNPDRTSGADTAPDVTSVSGDFNASSTSTEAWKKVLDSIPRESESDPFAAAPEDAAILSRPAAKEGRDEAAEIAQSGAIFPRTPATPTELLDEADSFGEDIGRLDDLEAVDNKTNKVRENLYRGKGYKNLGKHEEAEKEYKEVLRKDPYNSAARRGLEKVAAAQSDYYRSAYDHTRAKLLTEVDKAWEIEVPKGSSVQGGNQARVIEELKSQLKEIKAIGNSDKHPEELKLKNQLEGEERQREVLSKRLENEIKKVLPAPVVKPRPILLPEETLTAQQAFSTFSLNVSDVSFKLARAALLEKGQTPESSKIRTEEFVNAFDYGDPSPRAGQPVNCVMEQAAHPFVQQRNLLRIGVKTAAMGRSQPLRLTVLLDNSGSMERDDREASVKAAMQVLAAQLNKDDVVTVIGFARQPRLLAERIPGSRAQELVNLVSSTPSEGGTNLEEALKLGEQLAKRQHKDGAQSRIVLITDGVANLGNTVPVELAERVESLRQQGIAFDACGVGAEGLNDEILEEMTRKGDGRYYFLDKPEDADANFAKRLAGALSPAAKNVKVQVVFNPERVTRYRLLGFEKHRLNKEDFRNDAVDAAEMAAEEAGNAVYQIQVDPEGEGDVGEVFVRFMDASTGKMVERSWPIGYAPQAGALDQVKPSMQLAGVAALLGEKLKGTDSGAVNFSQLQKTLGELRNHYQSDQRVKDLLRMVEASSE